MGEQNSEAEAHQQLDYATARGVNFIDAAEMYPVPPRGETQGRTESIVGYAQLAASLGMRPATLALAFVRSRWFTASTIIGATSMAQLEENIASAAVELDAGALAAIEDIHVRYPNPAW